MEKTKIISHRDSNPSSTNFKHKQEFYNDKEQNYLQIIKEIDDYRMNK